MGRRGSGRHRPISPATTSPSPSFYKIILPSIMHHHKLRIPEDFANKYGNELSTFATLTVPSGQTWHVRVEKADKMLWFSDGWKEFAEHHSICCGFFIVFNYEGNSKFNVLIFDLTASEIHNPRNTLSVSEEPKHGKQYRVSDKGERGGDYIVETLGCSTSRPVPVSSDNNFFDECLDQQTTGKRRHHSLQHSLFEFAPEFTLRINKHFRCFPSLEILRSIPHYLTRNKQCEMEDQAKMIRLENVTISRKGKLKASEVPNSYRSWLDKPDKKKWDLTKNAENLQAAVPLVRHCWPSSGSKLENNINGADGEGQAPSKDSVFVQEATRRSKDRQQLKVKPEEEVELLGVNNSINFSRRQLVNTQEREKAVNAAMMFKSKNPYFMAILKLYNVHHSFMLNVPSRFGRKYLHGVSEFLELQVSGGKRWTVRCITVKGRQSLSRGWSAFVKENHLVEGDVCVFELIQVKDVVLQVTIFRAGEDARQNQPSEVKSN